MQRHTQISCICVCFYTFCWTVQNILIKQTIRDNLQVSKLGMVFCVESFKALFALGTLLLSPPDGVHWKEVPSRLASQFKEGCFLAVPALIYVVYNGLQFVNLSFFDPGTYRVLINVRVLFTGILFQLFFGKRLGNWRWFALCLLLVGCGVGQSGGAFKVSSFVGLGTMAIQAAASSLGGVYFQWMLQKRAASMAFWEKNFYLYFWGVVVNFVYLLFFAPEVLSGADLQQYTWTAWGVIFMGGFGGFSTALLLKYLDALMKEYANGLEMISLAILQTWLFDVPFVHSLFLSIVLVIVSLYIYNRNPPKEPELPKYASVLQKA